MDENIKAAVQCATRSLARCEQCRAGLERKLLQKEFESGVIQQALDFLEEKGYLSDARYAECWIRNHCAFKPQGRLRLVRELTSRGVAREVAKNAVEAYFEKVDEVELCRLAYQKLVSKQKTAQKIIKSLAESGFSYKIVTTVIKRDL